MIAILPSATGALLVVASLAKVAQYLRLRVSLRTLERVIASSPEHAHLVSELVAAEVGHRVDVRRMFSRVPPAP